MIIHFYSKNNGWCKIMRNKFKDFIDNSELVYDKYGIKIIIEKNNLFNFIDKEYKNNSIFVSPSNSLGRMEGGIDRIIAREIFPKIDLSFWKLIRKLGIINKNDENNDEYVFPLTEPRKTIITQLPRGARSDDKTISLRDGVLFSDPSINGSKKTEYFNNYPILPIGSSLFIEVDKENSGVIISPTMFCSSNVNHTNNAYISLLSSLLLFKKINEYKKNNKEKEFERIYITGHCCGNGGMSLDKSVNQFYQAFNDFIENKGLILNKEMDYISMNNIPDHMYILLDYKEEKKKENIDNENIKTIKIINTNQIKDNDNNL